MKNKFEKSDPYLVTFHCQPLEIVSQKKEILSTKQEALVSKPWLHGKYKCWIVDYKYSQSPASWSKDSFLPTGWNFLHCQYDEKLYKRALIRMYKERYSKNLKHNMEITS